MSKEDEYNELIKQISLNIREYRMKRGLSQLDMEQFGFDVKNYQKIEYGKHHCAVRARSSQARDSLSQQSVRISS